jgi:hypothetical protein
MHCHDSAPILTSPLRVHCAVLVCDSRVDLLVEVLSFALLGPTSLVRLFDGRDCTATCGPILVTVAATVCKDYLCAGLPCCHLAA